MKLLFCVLVGIICASSIGAFPTPKKDAPPQCIDPTFACQDLESAKLCGVVKDCIHDVWENMGAPDDNDQICDICKEMVKEARDQLLSNMTQEEIKEVFEGSCKLLPIKLVADACIKVVDEIIPQLVEMLASRMDPTMVCTVSGMCNMALSGEENKVGRLLRIILDIRKADECSDCTTMMTDVQTFLKDTPESDVKNYIEKFCDEKVPSYLCDILVSSYFPSLYKYIETTDAKTLCSSVGICPKVCNPSEVTKFNDELTCEFCEHVLQHIKDLVTANTTAEEFRTALKNFCKQTGSFADKCLAMVDDYYDMLFDYIRKLDTKGMCTLIGLCNSEKCFQTPMVKLVPALEAQRRIPLIKLQPAIRAPNNLFQPLVKLVPASVASKKHAVETNDIFPSQLPLDRFSHPLTLFQKDTECAFCKAISFFLEMDLNGDKSKDAVRKALNSVCDTWVKDYPSECKDFMAKYSLKFQHLIARGIKLDDICVFVKACTDEDKKSEITVKVIPKEKVDLKEKPFCDLCKDTMNEVENTLSDPAIKQKLEDLLDQYCNVLPDTLRDDCKNFINSNIEALLDVLQQELQPKNFCPAIHLCDQNSRINVHQRVKDLECDLCKDAVTKFREKLSDPSSKEMVERFLNESCDKIPGSLSEECKKFVNENIDTIIGMIISEFDPQTVCSILKICPASLEKEKAKNLKGIDCFLCKEVVGKVEELIKDKRTEEEIVSALERVCTYLPSSMSAKCRSFVDTYAETLITLFVEGMDPDMICHSLNLCASSLEKVKPKKFKDIECDLCKEVVGKVEDMIKDKKTEEEIKSALEKVCSYLPSSMSAKCKSFVDEYVETLITLLMEEMDPDMICATLNVCPTSLEKVKPKKFKDVECDLCKEVVGKVEDMIKDKKTEEEIKSALEKVCSYLPSSMSAKCKSFVDEYVETLITLLMEEMDPDMICATLNVCPKNVQYPEWKTKAINYECEGCQYALHFLQNQLSSSDTQDEVKNLLKKVCDLLPETFAKNCDAFVDEYGSSLLVLLAQEIDPSVMCYDLKMCTNQTKLFEKPVAILHPFNTDECSICTTVVDYIDKLLEEDDVDKELSKLVEKVCTILPASYVEKCSSMLDTYGPYILQMIGQVTNSKEVCQEIELCSRPDGHVHLLGGHKCTFGPSYWCKSNAHATACKAEMFCKENFWKN